MHQLYVLDTNVISELMRQAPAPQVLAWFAQQSPQELKGELVLVTTAFNLAEIHYGLGNLPAGKRKRGLLALIDDVVKTGLNNHVLGFDAQPAQLLGEVLALRKKAGMPIHFADACIAAICKHHQAAIVTRDVGGFVHTGIAIHNPWG
jgi:toxin FitB